MTHSHNYKYATFNRESAMKVNSALKETRELLQDVRRERERERERERDVLLIPLYECGCACFCTGWNNNMQI